MALHLLQDLATIAGKPLDRYQVNFKDEQRAKMHAFAILRSSKQGQSVLRHTLKMGRCSFLFPYNPCACTSCPVLFPETSHCPSTSLLRNHAYVPTAEWSASHRQRRA